MRAGAAIGAAVGILIVFAFGPMPGALIGIALVFAGAVVGSEFDR